MVLHGFTLRVFSLRKISRFFIRKNLDIPFWAAAPIGDEVL